MLTNVCTWSLPKKTDKDGTVWPNAQIDLLLCRGDLVIDVCEMKYCHTLFTLTGDYEKRIRERNETFVHFTKTTDAIHTILITTYGLREKMYSGSIFSTVTMDDLFMER